MEVTGTTHNGRPLLAATVGPQTGPTIVLHGHLDVVPGHAEQFTPRVEGDRLFGRGAYDMKGGLAAMMCALRDLAARTACGCTSSASPTRSRRSPSSAAPTTWSSRATRATSRSPASPPTCTSASRPRACSRCASRSGGTAAHGSTPWLGDNAVLKALDVFRQIESHGLLARVVRPVRPPVDQPRPHHRRRRPEQGAGPVRDRRRHPLPARPGRPRDPGGDRGAARHPGGQVFHRRPAIVERDNPFVQALGEAIAQVAAPTATSSRSAATAPRMRSRSSTPACPRSSSARSAAVTTAPRSGFRSPRWASIGRRSWSSSRCSRPPPRRRRGRPRLRIA